MKNIIEELNLINPAMFKKLSWIRLSSSTPLYNELIPSWTQDFTDALNSIKNIQVINTGKAHADEFHFNIAFMTPESHLDFIQNFYIEGLVKNLFKDHMRHSTQNKVAFQMSSVLPPSWKTHSSHLKLSAHNLYEICPAGIRMHAATKEHRESFPFFQWMLFLQNTCSISAYYDFEHKARHLQTLYLDYDSVLHEKIIEESKKYPSYFKNRYEYNIKNGIIHKQGLSEYSGDLFTHEIKESEFINNISYNEKSFALKIF